MIRESFTFGLVFLGALTACQGNDRITGGSSNSAPSPAPPVPTPNPTPVPPGAPMPPVQPAPLPAPQPQPNLIFQDHSPGMSLKLQISINSPREYTVFQRRSDSVPNVFISYSGHAPEVVYARLNLQQKWYNAAEIIPGKASFSVPGSLLGEVAFALYDNSGALLGYQTIRSVGVGEVFVIAGQSNSTNCGESPQTSSSGQVVSSDGQRWQLANDPQLGTHDAQLCNPQRNSGGSNWPTTGDELTKALGVPIAFMSTGYSGTPISEWQKNAPAKTTVNLYQYTEARLTQAMTQVGVRAVLWHQGENDAKDGTTQQSYYTQLKAIVDGMRTVAEVPWIVAQASYCADYHYSITWGASSEVVGAQQQLANDLDYVYPGPNTDQYTGSPYRANNDTNCHFSPTGLQQIGRDWAEQILAMIQAQ